MCRGCPSLSDERLRAAIRTRAAPPPLSLALRWVVCASLRVSPSPSLSFLAHSMPLLVLEWPSLCSFATTAPFPPPPLHPSSPPLLRVVIIGGGVVGCSVAYHLGLLGWGASTLLLESGSLGCGTTWHAAGLVGQLRATSAETLLSGVYGAQLYARLEADTSVATGFRQHGSLTIARTLERMALLHRQASRAAAFGITAQLISPAEAAQRWPYMRSDDLLGALWLPGDGSITSTDLTASLAAGARKRGVSIREGVRVVGLDVNEGAVRTVRTDRGDVRVEVTINCAGQWAREVGAMANVSIPLHSAEHIYIISSPLTPAAPPTLPVLRDPDASIYFREWSGGLVMGGFEPHAKPCFHHSIPHPFRFSLLPEDWDQFAPLMEGALHRVPALSSVGVRMVNGPESFTPDGRYLLGEVPGVRKLYVAAGMNSSGIASAGGAGRALAEWVVEGRPTMDLWAVDIRRFGPCHANLNFLRDRTVETLGLHYAIPLPGRELQSARPIRRSPVHHLLAARGAQWGSSFGWERATYFTTDAPASPPSTPFGRPAWSQQVEGRASGGAQWGGPGGPLLGVEAAAAGPRRRTLPHSPVLERPPPRQWPHPLPPSQR